MERFGLHRLVWFISIFGLLLPLLMAGCSTTRPPAGPPADSTAELANELATELANESTADPIAESAAEEARDRAERPAADAAGQRLSEKRLGQGLRDGPVPPLEKRKAPQGRKYGEAAQGRRRYGEAAQGRPRAARYSGAGRDTEPRMARSSGAARDLKARASRPSRSLGERPRRGSRERPRRKAPLELLSFEDYLELAPHLAGEASWYGPGFHRKKTANGEAYNQYGLTAAHRVLPMGTRVEVENLNTGAKVRVRINDRGPYKKGRIIDLSRSAAIRLGMLKKGTAPVRVTILRWPAGMEPALGLKAYRQFVVQVAAYPSASKAETQRHDLRRRFERVAFQIDRTSRGLFAVVAGPYDDEQRARRVASLLQQGGVSNMVRSYRK